jgi:hypothetical protein
VRQLWAINNWHETSIFSQNRLLAEWQFAAASYAVERISIDMGPLSKVWDKRKNKREPHPTQTGFEMNAAPEALIGHDIQSGDVRPHGVTVDIQSPGTGAIPYKKKPWIDLPGFIVYMKETRQKIRLQFSSKRRPRPSYVPPDDKESELTAVVFKNGLGETIGEKMLYDTGSSDNFVSEKIVDKYKLPRRPILQGDLTAYDTLNGPFTPTHYVEIELKDDSRNIEFTKTVFNVTKSQCRHGLVAGLAFMRQHGVKIDPTNAREAYVTTRGEANAGKKRTSSNSRINANDNPPAAKEARENLLKQAAEDRKYAQNLASTSTARSTTMQSRNSQGEHLAASSRTSTSSSAKANPSKT